MREFLRPLQGGEGQDEGVVTVNNARALRKRMTDAEQLLWRYLRNRSMDGLKFRRQHHIGPYIADFACVEKKIIIEADGGQHAEDADKDAARTAYLNSRGWTVLRFWNTEVWAKQKRFLRRSIVRLHKGHLTPTLSPMLAEKENGTKAL